MTTRREELVKQGYAYGSALALKEVGVEPEPAQETAVKLASDESQRSPALRTLIDVSKKQG